MPATGGLEGARGEPPATLGGASGRPPPRLSSPSAFRPGRTGRSREGEKQGAGVQPCDCQSGHRFHPPAGWERAGHQLAGLALEAGVEVHCVLEDQPLVRLRQREGRGGGSALQHSITLALEHYGKATAAGGVRTLARQDSSAATARSWCTPQLPRDASDMLVHPRRV